MPSVTSAAVVTHGSTRSIGDALERLRRTAAKAGVVLREDAGVGSDEVDIAVALGGDGTMLRALTRFLGSQTPVIGVNFGRVGFLTSIPSGELEPGLERVFAGEYAVALLPTLEVCLGEERQIAVNDCVIVSDTPGRIIELDYALDGEELGRQPCDGLICATPSGSTAYNLSNGGPVLVWGLDAAVITLVAPHTLHARPLVVGPGFELVATNATPDVEAMVLVDGHALGVLRLGATVTVRFGPERSRLATLPEQAFFSRYRRVFIANG